LNNLNARHRQPARRASATASAIRDAVAVPQSVNEAALSSSYQGQHEPGDSPPLTLGDEIL